MVNRKNSTVGDAEGPFEDDFTEVDKFDNTGTERQPRLTDDNLKEEPAANVAIVKTCPACNGTGAVAETVIGGKVDKWKNCPMCGATGTNPGNTEPNRCKECNNSRTVVESFVDGKPTKWKNCPSCNANGEYGSRVNDKGEVVNNGTDTNNNNVPDKNE